MPTILDFRDKLSDYIQDCISEWDYNEKALPSYHGWYCNDSFEFDVNDDEKYEAQKRNFKEDLEEKGWYYVLCHNTKYEDKWKKASNNKKLSDRIQEIVEKIFNEDFE